ncbi:hypothetical protein BJ165DRAFT_1414525 [Panaeolus papilionaceus]|nr:hypothetical protein BJ165DRAFT_1414525 [Panaeolus papilionaceus]
MATVLEHPTPVLNNMSSTNNPPVEVIDVDLFESPPQRPSQLVSSSRHASRPVRQQPETISLLDSDEEVDNIVRSATTHRSNPQRTRLFSPPPPGQPYVSIPPMPSIPAQFAGHTSFPMSRPRRRSAQPVPPIVRPNQEPFAFEHNIASTSAGPSRQPPPSHHIPAMGFGGALLSQRARLPRNQRLSDFLGPIPLRGRFAFTMPDDDGQVYLNLGDDEQEEGYIPRLLRTWAFSSRRQPPTHPAAAAKDKYKQYYTHPTELEPGFTADFAPASNDKPQTRLFPPTSAEQPIIVDDDEPSSHSYKSSSTNSTQPSSLSALLVCARCMSPLLLNSSMTEEDAKDRRVWGLRCGHLLDEKCLNELGQPEQVSSDSEYNPKGKGKEKGKARAVGQSAYGESLEEPNVVPVQPFQQENSMRSRLRARPSTQRNPVDSSESSSTQALDLLVAAPPAKRRRGAVKKPKIEAEYEWKCPVPSCNTVHVSVKVDGIWGPQKDAEGANTKSPNYRPPRGAIPVFA